MTNSMSWIFEYTSWKHNFSWTPWNLKTTSFGTIFAVSEDKEEGILSTQNMNTLILKVEI